MATYKEIQQWVKSRYGFTPQTCWIAHCKEISGQAPRTSGNRHGDARTKPCPPDKQAAIMEAFRHFGMID